MTASDARPPSDTGTTGWHRHFEKGRHIFADDECGHSDRHMRGCKSCRPVLVVDPAEARETIARVLCFGRDDSEVAGWWDRLPDSERNRNLARADAVLAALVGQEGNRPTACPECGHLNTHAGYCTQVGREARERETPSP